MIGTADIQAVAAQTNIPPPILFALSQYPGLPVADTAALTTEAQQLQSLFRQTGTWEGALSGLVSGDPSAYTSPTSATGGQVAYIMGIAGVRPTYGMNGWSPSNPSEFTAASRAFGKSMGTMAQQGGVVTAGHQQSWYSAADTARQGSYAVTAGRAASGATAPFSFESMPFPASGLGSMSESFGDRSGPGGYPEQGNDYGLAHGSPLNAAISGTIKVVQPSNPHSNTGLTVYIVRPDGSKMYYGHLAGTAAQLPVKDGQHVSAGEPIGNVGGVPGLDPFPGNSTGAHVEIGVYDARGVLYDPRPMLQAQAQAPQHATTQRQETSAGSTGNMGADAKSGYGATPDPAKVGQFANRLMAMNVTPEQFTTNFGQLASLRRRLTGQPTTLDHYAPYAGMDAATAAQAIRAEPHPVYPEYTVGQMHDTGMAAGLMAQHYGQRQTSAFEVSRLVAGGAQLGDLIKHYAASPSVGADAKSGYAPPADSTDQGDRKQGYV